MLLHEAIDIFLKEALLGDKTKENYRYGLELFIKFIKNCELNELKLLDVVRFQQCKLSTPSRRWTALIALKSLLNFFNDIYDYPCLKSEKIKVKRPQETPIPHVTEEFIYNLIESIKGDGLYEKRNRALILFMFFTGVRAEELTKISKKDVDFINRRVLIHGKGGKDRTVFFPKECEDYLKIYRDSRQDKNIWLFPVHSNNHSKNKQMTTNGLRKLLDSLSPDVKLSPHRIRKTTGKEFYKKTKDLRATQDLLGHSLITTTQKYTLNKLDELQDIYDEAFNGGREYTFEIKKNKRVLSRVKVWSADGENAKKHALAAKAAINQII